MGMPPQMRQLLRPIYFGWLDCLDWWQRFRKGQLHLPPRRLRDVGGSDFEATGREFLGHFRELCHLQPTERILEIGCGSGRMAMPLTQYITPPGSYDGIEVVKPQVVWCQRHITPHHPHFRFHHADLYNKRYNPQASQLAQDYRVPFTDASFDFIFLTSVFTHLLPDDMDHYLSEIARLLTPSGRLLATFFLLNDSQQKRANLGLNVINFQFDRGPYRIRDEAVPESAVAYQEDYLFQRLRHYSFITSQSIYYGSWSGRRQARSFQDILILHRRAG